MFEKDSYMTADGGHFGEAIPHLFVLSRQAQTTAQCIEVPLLLLSKNSKRAIFAHLLPGLARPSFAGYYPQPKGR